MPEPTPEAWAQIRHAYENTDQPLAHICAEFEVSVPTVRYRMKRWGWTRRKPFVPRQQPAAAAQQEMAIFSPAPDHPTPPALANTSAVAPPPTGEGNDTNIVPRLQAAVARVLPAIETIIARLAGGNISSDGLEKAGRALGALTRTLRELNGLLTQHNTKPDGFRCEYCDMPPEDADAFRENLARRIEAFLASREDPESIQPGSALPLEAQKQRPTLRRWTAQPGHDR